MRKAQVNLRKHGVAFEEAASAFLDERAGLINDPDHSDEEDRFILLGLSSLRRMLFVVTVERGERLRIPSARVAEIRERVSYGDRS